MKSSEGVAKAWRALLLGAAGMRLSFATVFAAETMPTGTGYWSSRFPDGPPLPANLHSLPAYELSPGVFLLDDFDFDYEQAAQLENLLNQWEAMSSEGPPSPPGMGEGGESGGGSSGGGIGLTLPGNCTGCLLSPVYQGTNVLLWLNNPGTNQYDLFSAAYLGITNWTYEGRWTNTSNPWVITNPPSFESYYVATCATNSDPDGLTDGYEVFMTRTDYTDPDTDYDGNSDGEETWAGYTNECENYYFILTNLTAATNPVVSTPKRLGHFRFNAASLEGERGQVPMVTNQLNWVEAWATKGVQLTNGTAQLKYKTVESDGTANINLRSGTMRFWFKPLWTSGGGTGGAARLLEVGQSNSNGWWTIFFDATGSTLYFASQTNGASATTNLTANVAFVSNNWYQVALTFTNGAIALYTNGVAVTTIANSFAYPGLNVRTNGFTLGSDINGGNQARGVFEDLETFNYPLSSSDVLEDFQSYRPPKLIPDLQQWLIGSAVTATNPVDRVNVWLDQSGKTNHAVSGGVLRPYWVDNAVNGHPVIHFDGSVSFDTYLGSFVTNWTAIEAFVVLRTTSNTSGSSTLWRLGGLNSAYPNASGEIVDDLGMTTGARRLGSISQGLTNFHLFNSLSRTGAWTARLNGVVKFASAVNAFGFASLRTLGSASSGRFEGDMAEVLIFNRPLSMRERTGVNRYFGEKYALLPTPQPPTNLTVNVLSPTQASVWWNAAANLNQTRYMVERSTNAIHFLTVTEVEGNSWIDSGLATNLSYYYRVKATNLAAESAYTDCFGISTPTAGLPMPLDPNVLKLWVKADAGPLVNHDGTVNQWLDQSGNTNSVLPDIAAKRPYLSSLPGALNQHPALNFFMTNWFDIHFSGSNGAWTNATAAEAFVVLKAKAPTNTFNAGLWRIGPGNSLYPNTQGNIQDTFAASPLVVITNVWQVTATPHLYNPSIAPPQWNAQINGTAIFAASGRAIAFYSSTPTLGYGLNGFDGDIVECLIYSQALTATQRATVTEYLRSKYNLWVNQ